MNRQAFFVVLISLFFGTSSAFAQLNGTYTIGGASPDYATISAAVNDLSSQGLSGPVFFQIRSSTYDEQVTIAAFTRTGNADDVVTFTRTNPVIQVAWHYSAATPTANWIVRLDGASYIKLNGIEFDAAATSPTGRLIVFAGGAHHNTVSLCTLDGHLGVSSQTGSLVWREDVGDHAANVFMNSTFTNGFRGIDWAGPGGGYNSEGMEVTGNTFSGQQDTGAYLFGIEGAVVSGNRVNSASWSDPNFPGIYVAGSLSDLTPVMARITQNTVDVQIGRAGIWLFGSGSVIHEPMSGASVVANNLVAVRDGTNGRYGLHIAAADVDIYHNTVRTTGADAEALSISDSYEDHVIKNNLLSAVGGAEAMIIGDSETYESDYNSFYTTGATLVRLDGTSYATLSAYQDGEYGSDDHSTSVPVTFVDTVGTNDLHLASPSNNDVTLLAPRLVGYTTDVDSDPRSSFAVYRGADEGIEILPLDNADITRGFYTVGGNSPDFL